MKVAISKIIFRHPEIPIEKYEAEIQDAKDWCRKCIKLRLDTDNINANLDDICYSVAEVTTSAWTPPSGILITAELEIWKNIEC